MMEDKKNHTIEIVVWSKNCLFYVETLYRD